MATAPLCKTCKTRHWYRDPHVWPKVTNTVTPVTKSVTQFDDVTVEVTAVTNIVTQDDEPVTRKVTRTYVPTEAEMIEAAISETHECPICGHLHHKPKTHAANQAAYRERKKAQP